MWRYALVVFVVLLMWGTAIAVPVMFECGAQGDLTFSPDGDTTQKIVRAIDSCDPGEKVLVAAYSFTSQPITNALVAAKKRGVDVRLLVDKGQEKNRYSGWKACVLVGIPTYFDVTHRIQHNKYIVFGQRGVCFGSFNFSNSAEHYNAENNIIVWSPSLAQKYAENWGALVWEARAASKP